VCMSFLPMSLQNVKLSILFCHALKGSGGRGGAVVIFTIAHAKEGGRNSVVLLETQVHDSIRRWQAT